MLINETVDFVKIATTMKSKTRSSTKPNTASIKTMRARKRQSNSSSKSKKWAIQNKIASHAKQRGSCCVSDFAYKWVILCRIFFLAVFFVSCVWVCMSVFALKRHRKNPVLRWIWTVNKLNTAAYYLSFNRSDI